MAPVIEALAIATAVELNKPFGCISLTSRNKNGPHGRVLIGGL